MGRKNIKDKNKMRTRSFTARDEMWERAVERAERDGLTVSEWIRKAIEDKLKRN